MSINFKIFIFTFGITDYYNKKIGPQEGGYLDLSQENSLNYL